MPKKENLFPSVFVAHDKSVCYNSGVYASAGLLQPPRGAEIYSRKDGTEVKKRLLCVLLLLSMTLTLLPTAAFAADGETAALSPDTGGLCEHHPEHDEACGYMPQTEDTAGAPCGHMCEICRSENGGTDPAGPAGASGDTMPTAAAARRQVRARPARNYLYGSPYQKKFQPVTDIPSRVGQIVRMRSRNIFVKRAIIGIT